MRIIEKLLLKSCAYSVLIVTLFFLFTMVTSFTEAAIRLGTFFLILLFGLLISLSDLILKIEKLHKMLRLLIHYSVLLVAFIVIFIISGNISASGAGAVFSAVFIFTVLYAVISLIVYLAKRSVKSVDAKLGKKAAQNKKPKSNYKPLYGSKNDSL